MGRARDSAEGGNGFAASAFPRRTFRRFSGDLDTDVCIIGASFAGLAAGVALARRGWSVAVLEAGEVGNGESANALGLVAPGFSQTIERIAVRVGRENARDMWALSATGAAAVRAWSTAVPAGGEGAGTGQLILQGRDDAAWAEREAEALRAFGAEAEVWPAARVEAALPGARRFRAVYRPDAFRVHPLDCLYGLAGALENAGGRIFEQAAVTATDVLGVRKRVRTAAGRLRANHLILASGESGQLYPPLAGRMLRLFRHVAVTASLGEAAAAAVPFPGVVSHRLRSAAQFYREGERIIWASPLTAKQGLPWFFARRAARQVGRQHPGLAGAKIAHGWVAAAIYAAHRMPLVGALAPEVWIADAFGDAPIGNAAMAGDLIARAIAEKDDRWRVFSAYGPVWTGGLAGRWLIRVALPWVRAAAFIADRSDRPRAGAGEVSEAAAPNPAPTAPAGETDETQPVPTDGGRPKRRRGKKGRGRSPDEANGKANKRQSRREAQTTRSVTT